MTALLMIFSCGIYCFNHLLKWEVFKTVFSVSAETAFSLILVGCVSNLLAIKQHLFLNSICGLLLWSIFLNPPADCPSTFQDVKILPLPWLLLILPQASRIDVVIGEDVQILSTKEKMSCLLFCIFSKWNRMASYLPFLC